MAEQAKLRTTLPLIRERVEALQYLARKDLTPKLSALELQQELVEAEQDLQIQNHRLTQLDAQIVTLRDSRQQAEQEFRGATLTAVSEAERKLAGLRQELIKARGPAPAPAPATDRPTAWSSSSTCTPSAAW